MKRNALIASLFLSSAVTSWSWSTAAAVSLTDGLTPLPGVTWNNLATASFDGPEMNAHIGQLAPFVDQQGYRLPSYFTGGAAGLDYIASFLVEITAYADINELSVCGPGGCTSIFAPSDVPGVSSSFSLAGEETPYYFSLLSQDATWNSFEQPDGLDHFIAFKVVESGDVTIEPVSGSGVPSSVNLSLLVGDLLIGIEDLPGDIGSGSDRDFNDMLFVLRVNQPSEEIPEPATLALLGIGALGAHRLRRKGLPG